MVSENERRRKGPVALAATLPRLLDKAFRRQGFTETSIVTEWRAIVGDTLAGETAPQRLVFPRGGVAGATLHVRVTSSYATDLQHLAPLVIERINGYFGFAAVARIALTQGPPQETRREATGRPPPDRKARGWISRRVGGIRDRGLRRALSRFGQTVLEDCEKPEG